MNKRARLHASIYVLYVLYYTVDIRTNMYIHTYTTCKHTFTVNTVHQNIHIINLSKVFLFHFLNN